MRRLLKYFKELNQVSKASLAYVLVVLFQQGIRFITAPIFTRLLVPEQYGVVTTYSAVESVLVAFATLNVWGGVFSVGLFDYTDDRNCFTLSTAVLSNISTVGFFAIILISWPFLSRFINLPIHLMFLMFGSFLFTPAYKLWVARERYELRYKAAVIVTILYSLLSSIGAIVCVLLTAEQKGQARLYGGISIELAICCIVYIVIAKKSNFRVKWQYIKKGSVLYIPLIPHYLSQHVLASADRMMISAMIGNREAGIYGVTYSVGSLMNIFWTAVNNTIIPLFYEGFRSKNLRMTKKLSDLVLVTYAAACFFVMLVAPELMAFFAPASYSEGIQLIPPIIGGTFFMGLYCLFGNVELFYKRTKMVASASFFAAALNVILNYIFIKLFGYGAAAYTTLFTYIIYSLVHYRNMRVIDQNRYYSNRTILLTSGVILAGAVLCPYMYHYLWLRIIIIAVGIIIAIINRSVLAEFLKLMRKKGDSF